MKLANFCISFVKYSISLLFSLIFSSINGLNIEISYQLKNKSKIAETENLVTKN
jgi:hypothetical protein